LADARSAAEAWADGEDFDLIGAVAVEPFKRISYEEDGETVAEYVTHLDGNPGDGRAPGWAYGFYTGERCISIVLAAGLGVLAEGFEACDGDIDAMPDWSVDSDEAAERLGDHEDWPDLGEDGTYFWALDNDDGIALWMVGASGEDGETAFAALDASSGEVLEVVHGFEGDYEGLIAEEEAGAGNLSPGGGSDSDADSSVAMALGDELVAEVDLGAMGRIDIQVSANAIVNSLDLVIEGPYGVVDEHSFGGTFTGMSQQGRSFTDLPPGHYTLTLTSGGSALLASLTVEATW
jgi:hypothetical protein